MKDMQKMNMTKGVLLGFSVGAAALVAGACSDDKGSTVVPGPTASTTALPTTTGPTGGTGTMGPTGGTGPAVSPTTTAPGTTTAMTTTTPMVEMSACTTLTYADGNIGNENTNFSATRSIYVYGDGTTSACTDDTTTPGTLCVEGNATDALAAFTNWGAGVGLQLAETDMSGAVVAPFDAAALGIKKLRFTVSNLSASRPLRVQISRVDDANITVAANNYQANGFLYGGTTPKPAKEGVNVFELVDFELPGWALEKIEGEGGLNAKLPAGGEILDPAGLALLHSLQFQVASDPGDDTEKYSFCLSNIEWLDAADMVVPVDVTTAPMGDGGMETMPAPTSGEPTDTSAPASSSAPMDSSGPATLDYATQIQPILTMKCGGATCHGATPAPDGVSLPGAMEPNAMLAGRIQTVIAAGAAKPMPPAGSPALTDEEKALLNEWADSK